MAFPTTTGTIDDRVRLRLGGDELHIAESYEVVEGILDTPSCFSLELGLKQPLAKLFTSPTSAHYPLGTKFELFVGDHLQMVGRIEGFTAHGSASRITIKGRDGLAALARTHAPETRSFLDSTYEDLVSWALDATRAFQQYTLHPSNAASRVIRAGIPISEIDNSQTISTRVGEITTEPRQNRIEESLLSFVRRHLDRAGLFLWAGTADGDFVLSQPNGKQQPSYRLLRTRGTGPKTSSVVDYSFTNDVTYRHGSVSVYGRGGGRVAGRAKFIGSATDDEMATLGRLSGSNWGSQGILYDDVNVGSSREAEFFARRKLAIERRAGWRLSYTIRGHHLPTPSGTQFAVLTPDTTIRVQDDEIGLNGVFYIESVRRTRAPHTLTEIRLMRLTDLIFGSGGAE